ncbi:hypothetical protein [Actinomadura litoris]|uniref:Uncharacterized protein n=1 Tax=Actinomadura litoris TaxID=2678616 RepID=A0A7K1LAZ1_9ACTN|nr:hypothetical protein [Actinomadura litoris]MUN41493.1 hypothetical protein [Actinomadura litoris]
MTYPNGTPIPTVPAPGRIGQGTVVEQSRAAAEVMAAVEVAQRFPRDVQYARNQMIESCKQRHLAERAFYRFPRAGGPVSGASVHLARELARCWGHIQYGIVEMRRDDEFGQSEMQAWAWDVQTNSRVSTTFIVPHLRDTKQGPSQLKELRDVYENNANQGSRRVREMIFAILPPWFVAEAKDLCNATLNDGGGVPLATRIANAIEKYAEIGITLAQLEAKVGEPNGRWTPHAAAQLGVIYQSIQRGEVRKEEEFPPPAATAEEILAARTTPTPAPAPPAQPAPASAPDTAAADAEAEAEAFDDPLHYSADEIAEMGGRR